MTAPTLDQVTMLPATKKATVTDDFIDENGHMNIRFYLELGMIGADLLIQEIGIGDGYRADRRMGVFSAEHHIRYYAELRLGDEITVHPRLLARSAKAVHGIVYLVDATHGRVANSTEEIFVHVGMDTRRPVDLPDDVAAGFDRIIAEHAALPWESPVCGAMGIRR